MEQKVRILKPEEHYRFQLVQAVAFETEYDSEKEKEKSLSNPAKNENCREIGVFSEDESVLYGCLLYNRYQCAFDGKEMLLGGIGGVATLPQYRRNGIIRTCMDFTLRDMYEQGYTFSYLYPFSVQYYRQFGFEISNDIYVWTIPFAEMPKKNIEGSVEQIFPGDSTEPLLEVYRKFYAGYNLSVNRKKYNENMEKEDLLKQKRYVFLYRNAKGELRGFFIYNKEKNPDGNVMNCAPSFAARNDFLFLDAEAFEGMLSFIKSSFGSYYKKLRFAVPANISLATLLGDSIHAQCERMFSGMVRVVNVGKALEMCRCKGEGEFRIEIKDNIFPENDGVWKISFAEGQSNVVEKIDDCSEPDITLPINDFSVLLCGDKGAEDIRWMPGVKVNCEEKEFDRIFYHKKNFIADLF